MSDGGFLRPNDKPGHMYVRLRASGFCLLFLFSFCPLVCSVTQVYKDAWFTDGQMGVDTFHHHCRYIVDGIAGNMDAGHSPNPGLEVQRDDGSVDDYWFFLDGPAPRAGPAAYPRSNEAMARATNQEAPATAMT